MKLIVSLQMSHHSQAPRVPQHNHIRIRNPLAFNSLVVLDHRRGYRYCTSSCLQFDFILTRLAIITLLNLQSFWGNLNWCHEFSACRLLTALVAFAWMNWIILFSLLGLSVLFTIVNAAFSEPMHGRYDPRESHYRDSGANYGAPMRDQEGLRRFMPW